MNKIKLFSIIILIEVLIIIVLLAVFLLNWKILSPDTYKINSSTSGLIYSTDKSVPYTGKIQDTIDNKLIAEFDVVDGIRQGEFILFTLDGNFAVKGFMKKNKNDGNWKYFYNNGQVECTGDFDNDEPVGKWTWFYKNGLIKSEGNFINGKPDGQWSRFNDAGKRTLLINYRQGEVINFIQVDRLIKV